MDEKERVYRKMSLAGGGSIAVGVVMLVIGLVCGVVTIINGAIVLGGRKDILM
ncbi:MAG: hypothetical protein K6F92_06445 [Lachnospiraceae bacterium]|nr:hypothetical protein [Lachnospiraceae bacterium]